VGRGLRGRRFSCDDTVKAEVQKWLRKCDVATFRKGVENLVRCDRCLNKLVTVRKVKVWCTDVIVFVT
jgi:hypothetical protein